MTADIRAALRCRLSGDACISLEREGGTDGPAAQVRQKHVDFCRRTPGIGGESAES